MTISRGSNSKFCFSIVVLAVLAVPCIYAGKIDATTGMPDKAATTHDINATVTDRDSNATARHNGNATARHNGNATEHHNSNETLVNRHADKHNVTAETTTTTEEPEELPRKNFTAITPESCEKEVPTGKLVGVRIAANCTTGRCQLPSNSSIKVEIDFDPGENTDILIPKIYGMIGPVEIAFPGLRKNVCDSVKSVEGKSCPLKKGTVYTYRREIPIKDEYPPIRVGVKWKFITDHNTTSICFIIKSEIVDHDE